MKPLRSLESFRAVVATMNRYVVAAVIQILIATPPMLRAEVITLTDGSKIEGSLTSQNSESVTVKTSTSAITLPRNRIASMAQSVQKTKTVQAPTDIAELIRTKRYAEAYLRLTQKKEPASSTDSKPRTDLVAVWDQELRNQISGMKEEDLRSNKDNLEKRIADAKDPILRISLSRQLAHILIALAKIDEDHAQVTDAQMKYKRAVELAPDIQGVTLDLINSFSKSERKTADYSVLKKHIEEHPDDVSAIQMALECDWTRDPWWLLKKMDAGPAKALAANKEIRDKFPDLLLACFNSTPYPSDAPFDRIACYERYLVVEPNADPTPLVTLSLQEHRNLSVPLLKWASWREKCNDPVGAMLAYDAAEAYDKEAPNGTKVTSLYETIRKEWKKQIYDQIQTPPFWNTVHERMLDYACFYPEDLDVQQLLSTVTAFYDMCNPCVCSGKITCATCGGQGSVLQSQKQTCKTCSGSGKVKESVVAKSKIVCPSCEGTGKDQHKIDAIEEQNLNSGGNREIAPAEYRCKNCGGSGYISNTQTIGSTEKTCPNCNGSCEAIYKVEVTCPTCGGSGLLTCPSCQGKGYILRATPRPCELPSDKFPSVPIWLAELTAKSHRFSYLYPFFKERQQHNKITVNINNYPTSMPTLPDTPAVKVVLTSKQTKNTPAPAPPGKKYEDDGYRNFAAKAAVSDHPIRSFEKPGQ